MEQIKEEVAKLYHYIASLTKKCEDKYDNEMQEYLYKIADSLTTIEFEIWRKEDNKNEL